MPSPFPGMDPFLEGPAIFGGLHGRLITYLQEFLQPRLPEPYYAAIGLRLWVEVSPRFIGPDVDVLRRGHEPAAQEHSTGAVAVAIDTRTKPVIVHVPHDELRQTFLNICTRLGTERLVTTIEVLSLTNKTPGEHGRDLYLRKQQEILDSKTHLVEIDLLRAGQHTTAVPLDRALEKTGPFDYHVCVHQFDKWEDFFVYPFQLGEPLPEIMIPLLPDDQGVLVPLQAIFDRCYDAGPYRRRVRYHEDTPVPPLRPEQAEWARKLLHEKGMLSAG